MAPNGLSMSPKPGRNDLPQGQGTELWEVSLAHASLHSLRRQRQPTHLIAPAQFKSLHAATQERRLSWSNPLARRPVACRPCFKSIILTITPCSARGAAKLHVILAGVIHAGKVLAAHESSEHCQHCIGDQPRLAGRVAQRVLAGRQPRAGGHCCKSRRAGRRPGGWRADWRRPLPVTKPIAARAKAEAEQHTQAPPPFPVRGPRNATQR